jgi:hypothetical protein
MKDIVTRVAVTDAGTDCEAGAIKRHQANNNVNMCIIIGHQGYNMKNRFLIFSHKQKWNGCVTMLNK